MGVCLPEFHGANPVPPSLLLSHFLVVAKCGKFSVTMGEVKSGREHALSTSKFTSMGYRLWFRDQGHIAGCGACSPIFRMCPYNEVFVLKTNLV